MPDQKTSVLESLWSTHDVHFALDHFLACSGARTSYDHKAVSEDSYKWLHNQFVDLDPLVQDDRLTLVSITIGANDFHWTEALNFVRRLSQPTAKYLEWVDRTSDGVAAELRYQVARLLENPNVAVVITEIH